MHSGNELADWLEELFNESQEAQSRSPRPLPPVPLPAAQCVTVPPYSYHPTFTQPTLGLDLTTYTNGNGTNASAHCIAFDPHPDHLAYPQSVLATSSCITGTVQSTLPQSPGASFNGSIPYFTPPTRVDTSKLGLSNDTRAHLGMQSTPYPAPYPPPLKNLFTVPVPAPPALTPSSIESNAAIAETTQRIEETNRRIEELKKRIADHQLSMRTSSPPVMVSQDRSRQELDDAALAKRLQEEETRTQSRTYVHPVTQSTNSRVQQERDDEALAKRLQEEEQSLRRPTPVPHQPQNSITSTATRSRLEQELLDEEYARSLQDAEMRHRDVQPTNVANRAAPCDRWIPDSAASMCMNPRCNASFSKLFGIHRHHCRFCGGVFCDSCTSKRKLYEREPYRCCDQCF